VNRLLLISGLLLVPIPALAQTSHAGHAMEDMDMASMQDGRAPADARDPDAYADGLESESRHLHMGGGYFGSIMLEKFEYYDGEGSNGFNFDGDAWYGSDYNRLWFKADGGRSRGDSSATRMEALWSHALTPYWDTQLGLRHDAWEGPARNWVVLGMQGLAPYWFDVEAAFYVGENGRTAFRAEADYDLLLTQRLILQPAAEISIHGKDDEARDIGSGLSEVELGLRLRYEFRREFAPYVGIAWHRKYGDTADLAEKAGEETEEAQLVLGFRFWY
jgi:copper resistance protein B